MRQFATAWDGVALEICERPDGLGTVLKEDGEPVGAGTQRSLRIIAKARCRDRFMEAHPGQHPDYADADMGGIMWKTCP